MNHERLARLQEKLHNFPPYDWEDDVEGLITEVRDLTKKNEVLIGERQWILLRSDILHDALTKIRSVISSEDLDKFDQILSLIRAAEVRTWGER